MNFYFLSLARFHHILGTSLYPISSIIYEPLRTPRILFPESVLCCCIKYGGRSRSPSQRKGRGVVLGYPEVLFCDSGTSGPHPRSPSRLQHKARGYMCITGPMPNVWGYPAEPSRICLLHMCTTCTVHVCFTCEADQLVCFTCATRE